MGCRCCGRVRSFASDVRSSAVLRANVPRFDCGHGDGYRRRDSDGATVTIHNVATGIDRITQTDIDGGYLVPELADGHLRRDHRFGGFQKFVTKGVIVDIATEKRVDAVLKPGAVNQQVWCKAKTLPQVDTTSNTLGGVLSQDTVKDLPMNGRDYTKLIFLNPGVAGSPDQISDSPGSYGEFSMNGARGRSNNYLLDGTDMNDGYRNDPAINQAAFSARLRRSCRSTLSAS